MRYFHKPTQKEYNTLEEAGKDLGILGLNTSNANTHSLAPIGVDPKPAITNSQKLVRTAKPVEKPDGSVAYQWSVENKTTEELQETRNIQLRKLKEERDRRLEADFEFAGKMFQRDSKSLDRITGAATLAGFAIANGAQVGDLRWANPDRDFGWIASDDTVVPMDAQTAFQFGQVAASIETSIIFAAKTLREMNPIPADFADDKYWP